MTDVIELFAVADFFFVKQYILHNWLNCETHASDTWGVDRRVWKYSKTAKTMVKLSARRY